MNSQNRISPTNSGEEAKKREIPAYPVTTLPSYSILLVDKFGDNKFILSGNYKDITMIANSISKILDVDIVL